MVGVAQEAKIPEERVVEVGHPETEAVLTRVATLQPYRDDIRDKKLGASPTDRVVYFAGGRDKPGQLNYAQAFSLFVRGALSTATHADFPLRVFATLHPASDGATERQILTELNAATAVRLLRAVKNPVTPREISNEELMVAADAAVT